MIGRINRRLENAPPQQYAKHVVRVHAVGELAVGELAVGELAVGELAELVVAQMIELAQFAKTWRQLLKWKPST